jgi:hypothetical protein
MQSNFADWYKIIDITRPDESLSEKRKGAIDEITEMILDSAEQDYLAACVVGAARGFEILGKEAEFTQAIIQRYQAHIVSLSSNLADNAMELRVAAGLALEEILSRAKSNEDDTLEESKVLCSLLLSALGIIPAPSEQFLAYRIEQLKLAARNLLDESGRELRERQDLDLSSIEEISGPPDQATWSRFVAEVVDAFHRLEQQVAADKEELEILWWLQNGISKRLGQPFKVTPIFKVALYSGLELAEMAILPPFDSMAAVLQKVIEKDRTPNEIKPKLLTQIVNKKDIDTWSLLVPKSKEISKLVLSFPSLFPVSWLGVRLQESRGAAWEEEFSNRTGVQADQQFTPAQIAEQVFRERIALRVYEDFTKD